MKSSFVGLRIYRQLIRENVVPFEQIQLHVIVMMRIPANKFPPRRCDYANQWLSNYLPLETPVESIFNYRVISFISIFD